MYRAEWKSYHTPWGRGLGGGAVVGGVRVGGGGVGVSTD